MVTLYLALYAVISMLPTTCTRCHCCIQLVDMHQLYVLCISYVLMSSISILVQFFMVLYLQKQVCPQISRKFALSKHFPLYFVHQLCICCSLLHRLSLITGSPFTARESLGTRLYVLSMQFHFLYTVHTT